MQRLHARLAAALFLVALPGVVVAQAPAAEAGEVDPLHSTAEVMPLADRSLLLDVVAMDSRFLTVGERGHVLWSNDGTAWTQSAQVPVRSTLTATTAIGADVWAVGHDGVILHSGNGGETWELQRYDPHGFPAGDGVDPLRQGVPLLDVIFTDINHGFAIGAYSLFLRTEDGGKTWSGDRINSIEATPTEPAQDDSEVAAHDPDSAVFSAEELEIGQEDDPHLNAIARTGSGNFIIVGERGVVFRSRDGGASWEQGQMPYDGSMFGVIGFEGDHVLAFGLRGHVFESTDLGVTWSEVPTGTELSLMGGAALADGGAVIVGANGIILQRARSGEPLRATTDTAAGVIANVVPIANAPEVLIASENGIRRHSTK